MADLTVEQVHKTLGPVHVLKGASFSGENGKVVALLGASGSGKTTLLRTIAGLEVPEQGRITIGGTPVVDAARGLVVPPEKRNIGLVFQSYALWPHKTVAENVAFGLRLRRVSSAGTARRVASALGQLGLGQLGERYPFQLSGGQQQRVAICRALVYEPSVLLLDEPLSNLDAKLREEARFWIRKLILDLGLCAVVVTHDQGEALAMSDRILLLENGTIIQQGSPLEIYSRPASRYAAEFLGVNNVVAGTIAIDAQGGARMSGDGWSLDGTPCDGQSLVHGRPGVAVIRMERVRLVGAAGPNRLRMRLEAALYLGERWEYRLACGDLALRAWGDRPGAVGDEVWCECPREAVWLFPAGA